MKSLDDLYQEAYDYLLNEEEIIGFYSAPEIVESWNNIYDFISSIGYVISSQIIFVRRRKTLGYIHLRSLSLIINEIIKPIKSDWDKKSRDDILTYIKEQFSSLYSVSRTKKMIQNYFPINLVAEDGLIIKKYE